MHTFLFQKERLNAKWTREQPDLNIHKNTILTTAWLLFSQLSSTRPIKIFEVVFFTCSNQSLSLCQWCHLTLLDLGRNKFIDKILLQFSKTALISYEIMQASMSIFLKGSSMVTLLRSVAAEVTSMLLLIVYLPCCYQKKSISYINTTPGGYLFILLDITTNMLFTHMIFLRNTIRPQALIKFHRLPF